MMTCIMCHGTGVYPYNPGGGVEWGKCGVCNGHGIEPGEEDYDTYRKACEKD